METDWIGKFFILLSVNSMIFHFFTKEAEVNTTNEVSLGGLGVVQKWSENTCFRWAGYVLRCTESQFRDGGTVGIDSPLVRLFGLVNKACGR
jgi:hypothetical protein